MSAVTRRKDIHVAVDIDLPSNQHNRWTRNVAVEPAEAERRDIAAAQEVVALIRRHIDGITGVAVAFDTVTECEFCEASWNGALITGEHVTEWEPEGMPACCDRAQRQWWLANLPLWPAAIATGEWGDMTVDYWEQFREDYA